MSKSQFARFAPVTLSVMRLVLGFMFAAHGTQKLSEFPAASANGSPELMSRLGAAGVIELVCGVLIMVGFFTRPAAFLASGLMAFAYFIAHAGQDFWPLLNGGELAVAYCFTFLYISVAGAGPWSIDHMMAESKHSR